MVGLLLIGWFISLLVDRRVRWRATGFEGPLLMIVAVTLGSDLANPGRVGSVSSFVVKELWLFGCFVLFVYLIASVVKTREAVDRIVAVCVSAGTLVAIGAIVQRRTGYNVFLHLHAVLPMFHYDPTAAAAIEERGGGLRAFASAGHPIEFSTVMAMMVPFAVYLAVSRRKRIWWLSASLLALADFTGGSRTGIIGVAVVLVVFLWLRPRQTLRCWPALIPLLIALHFAAPGALGNVVEEFFPKGGLVHQQSETEVGPKGEIILSSRLSRIGPVLHEYNQIDPLLGLGYGTRVTGRATIADNAIVLDDEWLDTLLETGLLGVLAWMWLFGRGIRRAGARAKLERDSPEGWLAVALAASLAAFGVAMFLYDAFGFVQGTFFAFTLVGLAGVVLRLPVTVPVRGRGARLTRARPASPSHPLGAGRTEARLLGRPRALVAEVVPGVACKSRRPQAPVVLSGLACARGPEGDRGARILELDARADEDVVVPERGGRALATLQALAGHFLGRELLDVGDHLDGEAGRRDAVGEVPPVTAEVVALTEDAVALGRARHGGVFQRLLEVPVDR